MSKKNITLNNGTDFIDVRVEVSDKCAYLGAALDAGISTAMHSLGHAMPIFVELAGPEADSLGTVAMTPITVSVGDVTCAVRVHGRINGVSARCMNDVFHLIATEVCEATAHAMAGPPEFDITSIVMLSDILSGMLGPDMVAGASSADIGYESAIFGAATRGTPAYSGGYVPRSGGRRRG